MTFRTLKQAEQELRELKEKLRYVQARETYQKDLFKLCHLCGWKDLGEMHLDLCNYITDTYDKYKRRLFLLPRSHYKTSVITQADTIRLIINNPNIRILIVSYTGKNVKDVIGSIKNVFWYNEDFRAMFPEFCPPIGTKEFGTQTQFTVPNRTNLTLNQPTVDGASVGTAITGRHYDYIKLSDVVIDKSVTTKEQMKKTRDWVALLESILSVPETDHIDMEGTRYHYNDLHGEWEKHYINNEWKNLGLYKKVAIVNNKPLFHEKFSMDGLEAVKKLQGSYVFSSQYMLEPLDDDTAMFKRSFLQYIPRMNLPKPLPQCYTTVDPAISQKESSDFSVITTSCFTSDNKEYVIDIKYGHWDTKTLLEKLIATNRSYKPTRIGIECVAFQTVIYMLLQEWSRTSNEYLPITQLTRDTRSSKHYRISAIQPRYENRDIYFCDDLDKSFIEDSLFRYSASGSKWHDDLLDTLADMEQIKMIPNKPDEVSRYANDPLGAYFHALELRGEERGDFEEELINANSINFNDDDWTM